MRKCKTVWASAAGLVVSGLATLASASTIESTLDATLIACTPSRAFNFTLDGTDGATVAGQVNWTLDEGAALASFCIELPQGIEPEVGYTFEVVSLNAAPTLGTSQRNLKADRIRELWGRYFDQLVDSDFEQARDKSAAFQVAIWEILADTDLHLDDGILRIHYGNGPVPAYLTTAQAWLDSLTGDGPKAHLAALTHAEAQDQVFAVSVPLPSAAWAGLLLLGAMAVRKYRHRQSVA